jgi:hypothetical protein
MTERKTSDWGGEEMNQQDRTASRRPREGDLEKNLRPDFKEYEEWRSAQAAGVADEPKEQAKPARKGFKLGRWDLVFLLLGVLGALIYQSCRSGGAAP